MKRIISVLASTALLLGIFAAAPAAVSATSFAPASEVDHWVSKGGRLVSDGSGGYSCSRPGYRLIEDAAAQAEPGEVIHICRGTYFESDIDVSSGVTIQGDGPNRTFIDALERGRIFYAWDDALDEVDLTLGLRISDMTLRNGDAYEGTDPDGEFDVFGDAAGGAILSLGKVDCSNVRFTNNHGGVGGAVFSLLGVNTDRCTFTGNSAVLGGAVYAWGTIHDNGGTYANNVAEFGGAIFSYPYFTYVTALMYGSDDTTGLFTNTFTNSTFTKNLGGGAGGALAIEESCVTITNSVFSKNSSAGAGGAVYLNEGSFNLMTDILSLDAPDEYFEYLPEGVCRSSISNSKFELNNATLPAESTFGVGGAVAYFGGLDDSTGAAIYDAFDASAGLTITNTNFKSNVAANGGALYVDDGIVRADGDVNFYGNRARQTNPGGYGGYGSAVYLLDESLFGGSYEGSWYADTRHRATFERNTDPVHEEGIQGWFLLLLL